MRLAHFRIKFKEYANTSVPHLLVAFNSIRPALHHYTSSNTHIDVRVIGHTAELKRAVGISNEKEFAKLLSYSNIICSESAHAAESVAILATKMRAALSARTSERWSSEFVGSVYQHTSGIPSLLNCISNNTHRNVRVVEHTVQLNAAVRISLKKNSETICWCNEADRFESERTREECNTLKVFSEP